MRHPYPEVTDVICRVPSTFFSQAPWYTLPDHQCRFRVRTIMLELFPGTPSQPPQSSKRKLISASVTSSRLTNINVISIGYAFRPHLRAPAHPARINLAQEPLVLRR